MRVKEDPSKGNQQSITFDASLITLDDVYLKKKIELD